MTLIHDHRKLSVSVALLAALAAVLAALAQAWLWVPLTHSSARERWDRQDLRHYEMEVVAQADGIDLHLLVEVRDEQLVRGVNLRTGSRLTADQLAPYLIWLPIERLFDRIEVQRYSGTSWRHQVAELSPWIAQQLRWCLVRPLHAVYDPQRGYPSAVRFRHNICSPRKALDVRIGITPLPN
jgi:flagellar biogenesis protein FliO